MMTKLIFLKNKQPIRGDNWNKIITTFNLTLGFIIILTVRWRLHPCQHHPCHTSRGAMKPLSYFTEGMKPAAFIFQESFLAFWADKARPSTATNKVALPTPTRSACVSLVQLTQAQQTLPGSTFISVLVLRLVWYRIFPANSSFLLLVPKPELLQQLVAADCPQIPASEGWQASLQHRQHCQAGLLLSYIFSPNPSNYKVKPNQTSPLL